MYRWVGFLAGNEYTYGTTGMLDYHKNSVFQGRMVLLQKVCICDTAHFWITYSEL